MSHNVPVLGEVANFGTNYFLLKIIFLAKREREFTIKFAIARNGVSGSDFIVIQNIEHRYLTKYAKIDSVQVLM